MAIAFIVMDWCIEVFWGFFYLYPECLLINKCWTPGHQTSSFVGLGIGNIANFYPCLLFVIKGLPGGDRQRLCFLKQSVSNHKHFKLAKIKNVIGIFLFILRKILSGFAWLKYCPHMSIYHTGCSCRNPEIVIYTKTKYRNPQIISLRAWNTLFV